jgi:hypothetical protein
LHETYDNILGKVAPQNTTIVRRILLWLCFSVLPLTLEELHEAVAIEEGLDHINADSRLHRPEDILMLCGSLVNLSEQGHVVLAHLSVKDYLLSPEIRQSKHASYFAMSSPEPKHELAVWCLAYLRLKELAWGPTSNKQDYIERLETHPFLKHATIAWSYYVRAAPPTPQLQARILEFFGTPSRKVFLSWVQVLNANTVQEWDIYPKHATSLYYAASFGLSDIVASMIRDGVPLNSPGSRFGGTALHVAVLRNHVSIVKILLEAGADARQADFNMTTPLHTAAARAHTTAMIMLLEHGALKEALDCNGETPLDWAIHADQASSKDILSGKSMVVEMANAKVGEVWHSPMKYFPGFNERRRSGMESSYIVKVEH